MLSGHSLRIVDMLDKTVLCCSCGLWLETVPFRLHESQNDDKMRDAKHDWLEHARAA